MAAILIVEDEAILAVEIRRYLELVGPDVRVVGRGDEALALAAEEPPDLALLDLRLPDASGLDVLERLRAIDAALPIVLMTAFGSVRDAVEAMRRGAFDYVQKPLDLDELALIVERALARRRADWELDYLRGRERVRPDGVVGDDPRVLAIFSQVDRLAQARLAPGARPAILLTGETGTGKGMLAHAIHEILGGGPFVELNCAAMPESLIESELFGHERGAFTDARLPRPGLFEAATGGTIFLDEIAELELAMQAKFLKVIEEKRVRRLGSSRDRNLDVHVIAATNRRLPEEVAAGRFREDLFHRLQVLAFEVPPLRERRGDLLALARHFAGTLGRRYRGEPCRLAPDAEAALCAWPWPGNVRELRNALERAVLLGRGAEIGVADLPGLVAPGPSVRANGSVSPASPRAEADFVLPESGVDIEALERDLLRQALARAGGNRTRAAALLGLTRHALRYRMEKFGLQ